jgi:hypothetical protein
MKSVPCALLSHPFVERLIGTIRREYFDQVFFWNAADLARKLNERPRDTPAHPQQSRPRLTTTRGGHIAAVCFSLRSPPDLYFATHSAHLIPYPAVTAQ